MIEKLIKKSLKDFKQYKANPAAADIILDANEIPFDLSAGIKEKITDMIGSDTGFNRYPDPSSNELKIAIALKYGCSPDNVTAGSGSDQLISVIANAFIDPGEMVMAPAPSFDMYRISSVIANACVLEYDLEEDYGYDISKMKEIINEYSPKIIFICSPNNPTGNQMSNNDMEKIIKTAVDSVVVIDEAYVDFAESSFIKEVLKYENAVVLRTFSKAYGLAGLRCGFSISCEGMADQLQKTLPPYNLNRFTQFTAKAVLEDKSENERRIRYIKIERDRMMESIKVIKDLKVFPSSANFFLLRSLSGIDLYEKLLEKGIRIRKFTGKRLLDDCFRISIGTEEENDILLKSIYDVFK